jgi:hypothetical protein
LLAKPIEEDPYDEDVPGVGVRGSPVIGGGPRFARRGAPPRLFEI